MTAHDAAADRGRANGQHRTKINACKAPCTALTSQSRSHEGCMGIVVMRDDVAPTGRWPDHAWKVIIRTCEARPDPLDWSPAGDRGKALPEPLSELRSGVGQVLTETDICWPWRFDTGSGNLSRMLTYADKLTVSKGRLSDSLLRTRATS